MAAGKHSYVVKPHHNRVLPFAHLKHYRSVSEPELATDTVLVLVFVLVSSRSLTDQDLRSMGHGTVSENRFVSHVRNKNYKNLAKHGNPPYSTPLSTPGAVKQLKSRQIHARQAQCLKNAVYHGVAFLRLCQEPVGISTLSLALSHGKTSEVRPQAGPRSRGGTTLEAFLDWQLLRPMSTLSCTPRNCGRCPGTGNNMGDAGRREYPVGRK
ncbi:pyruvate dehydrogenase [Aspergillus luchuensis]|uniref:Pyruvate dehydrogenase n=1 Tax=Aspergillus kawachii TaxID=1069201 RepID=A0A146EYR7_ASPKA|nr:pyruvate dehydrogenase [Aspergillus luchuensis]